MNKKDNDSSGKENNKKNPIAIDVWALVSQLMKTPALHVNRESFLREKLANRLDEEQLNKVLVDGDFSGINEAVIDDVADDCIKKTRLLTSGASFLTGLPSSLPALPATASVDIAQSFGFYIRIAQELAYLYGEAEDFSEMNDGDKKVKMMLFIGSMFGIAQASAALVVIGKNAGSILAKKFNQIAVTKIFGGVLWKIAKGIAKLMSVKLTKEVVAKGISKVVPIIGGVASGVLTYVTFERMARKLQDDLHAALIADEAVIEAAIETIEDLENSDVEEAIVIDEDIFDKEVGEDGVVKRQACPIKLQNGIAAIDAITLKMAAAEAEKSGFAVTYPDVYDVPLPETFGDLAEIVVDLPVIKVTIDTQKMRWGCAGGELGARAGSFRDYAGADRYCVEFQYELPVCKVLKHDVVRQAMHLESGEPVFLWAAEVPAEQLAAMSYPSLYELARNITKKYDGSRATEQLVTIPAVQMKFEREMDEVQGVAAIQEVYMALDETGARVKAVTTLVAGVSFEEPKIFHFGERHPVVYWFTENTACSGSQGGKGEHGGIKAMAANSMKAINSAMHSKDKDAHADASKTPFAVIATTTDAWLKPGANVSFADVSFADVSFAD